MSRTLLLSLAILFVKVSFSQIPPGYYNPAVSLSGEPLRTALYNIINGHNEQSYAALWTHFQTTDNNGGIVWDMYTDNPVGVTTYTYTFGSDQCGNYSVEGDCYNREHSFPKSWFNDGTPMYSDLFHVYPVDGYVNGVRGNLPYGEVTNPNSTTSNGNKRGPNTYPGYTGTVFEPIDEYKGDFARSYFYMVTRYKNVVSTWTSDMLTADNLSSWAKTMLISWDALDPVSQKEIDRNNAIYNIQGNRNPFIDYPHWIDWIWGPTASVSEVENQQLSMYFVNDGLHVSNFSTSSITVNIVNMLGENVSAVKIQPGENNINLSIENGIYIANALINNVNYTLKFVK